MKKTQFRDMRGHEIQISLSSGGDFRIYYDVEKDTSPCLLLNKYQVNILINALKDLMNEE